MTSEKVVFRGGPADGERLIVPDRRNTIVVFEQTMSSPPIVRRPLPRPRYVSPKPVYYYDSGQTDEFGCTIYEHQP